MEIVLLEDIPKLGHIGDIVRVRDGYARNYLIPRKKALEALTKNVKALEHQKRMAAKKLAKARGGAEQIQAALEKVELTFKQKAGESGKLFGSVTNIMIAEELARQEFSIDRHNIQTEPIKSAGSFTVPVKLHRDVTASLRVVVVAEISEAQKKAQAEAEAAKAASEEPSEPEAEEATAEEAATEEAATEE